MRIYYWQCGHKTTDPGRTCPKCKKGQCMAVGIYCSGCETFVTFKKPRNNLRYCDTCKARKKKAAPQKKVAVFIKKPDCSHYLSECLPEHAFKNKDFTCEGCEDYAPTDLDVMSFCTRVRLDRRVMPGFNQRTKL
jgi:hypothetical protein